MMKKGILIILTTLLLANTLIFAQDNPFTSDKPRKGIQYPSFIKKFIKYISSLQRDLNHKITELSKEIKERKSVRPFLIIIFITFIYGMVHALGPGHGKTITFSYFLAENAEVKKGIMVGTLIGFLHALSALILVLILYFIIQQTFLPKFENFGRIIRLISYGVITIIGLFLLFKAIISFWGKETSTDTITDHNLAKTKPIIPFAIAVGLTPCTGAMIVLLFSISMGILYLGIISTFFMALGMAATISIVGVSTILAKENLTKYVITRTKTSKIIQTTISIIGALLITVLGVLLFTSTL